VTCDYFDASFTVTATATDVTNTVPGLDSIAGVDVECAEDACEAARGPMGLAAENPGDIDNDCDVDLDDLAVITASWLNDYTISVPEADNRI
jgi:hypothetical protein